MPKSTAQKQKIGLCLAGGGGLGFAHIGLFRAMDDLGIRPDIICGTSSGAILGAFYAAGYSTDEIMSRLSEFKWTRLIAPPALRRGLVSTTRMQSFLRKQIGFKNIEDLPLRIKIAAVNLHNGTLVGFDSGPLAKCLAAASAMPGILEPVRIGDGVYYDAGGIYNLPLELFAGENVSSIIAANTIGKSALMPNPKTPQDVFFQAYLIRTMHLTALRLGPKGWSGKQKENVILIDYPSKGSNPYNINEAADLIDDVYKLSKKILSNHF